MEHLHPDDRPRVTELRRQMHEGEQERFSIEYRYLHPGSGERWLQHLAGAATRDASGHAVRTYGVLRDVTDRKQAEEESRDLSRRLIRAQEEERALLARELHDDVSQRLAVLAIDVGRAELAAADGAQAEAMRAVREGLVSLSEDIHSLAYQLHPSVLEELGLIEALRAECERRVRGGALDVSADLGPLPTPLTAEAALCLFRVAQEALSNVARHAASRLRDSHAAADRRRAGARRIRRRRWVRAWACRKGDAPRPRQHARAGATGARHARHREPPGRGTKVIAWVPVEEEGS